MNAVGRIKEGHTDKAELLALFVVEVKQSLEDQSGNAQQLIASVLASHDIGQFGISCILNTMTRQLRRCSIPVSGRQLGNS
jgi:hypothetical protein